MQFQGTVIEGLSVGDKFGIATANIQVDNIPKLKEGVYLVEVFLPSSDASDQIAKSKYQGLMHFGARKTFGGDFSIEIHILDFEQNIYSKEVSVETLEYLRPTKQFRNSDELYSQIEKDIIWARKYFIRREIWAHWRGVSPQQEKIWEATSLETIIADQDFLAAELVLLYAPEPHKEINFVERLIELCPNKAYYFPKVEGKALGFYRAEDYRHLHRGFKNIREPYNIQDPLDLEQIALKSTLIFVPCVGMGHDYVRLGQGGGFYDRFLSNLPKRDEAQGLGVKTISVLPHFAYRKDIPKDPWDQEIDKLVVV